jgi:hypothetical protein
MPLPYTLAVAQVVQLVGAFLVVSAYVAFRQNRLRLDSAQFLGMNMLGAGILTIVAAVDRQLGFLLLEGMWTWVSARGFRRALKAQRATKGSKRGGSSRSAARPNRRRNRPNPLRRV